ncbi:MAG TPA: protein kinase, partial [Myxococcaceae bacterium]|nr:protein kinase [Myxococcaceae bacterium]
MSGRYRLLGQIETGELAELYAASRDGQPVVVKLFHTQTTDARYAQELAEIARQLQTVPSDGIAKYVELGLVKGRLAVVREDVQGLTLGLALQRLASKEVLIPTPVTLAFLIELLDAVQLAHDAGVVHGAITPGNVFIRPDGRPVLLDFGALRALQAVPALKKVFPARGRSAYRAQEVTRGDPPDELSDVYSVGAIAYEMLTLREATSGNLATMSTRREPLPPPSRLDRRLNSRIDPIVMRALDQQATRRFRSCGEFAVALRNFLTDNGGMPLREDVQRVVRDLSHGRPGLGPVPFSEPFTLQEVAGAELPPITERSMLLAARPSFSGRGRPPPPDDAETVEGAPAFEEYKPDPRYDDPEPRDEPDPDYDDGKPPPPVPLDEPLYPDTDPGQAPPRRQGSWDAPPGAAPRASRRSMSLSQPAVPARPPVKNPRMRVREDFDAES